MPSFFCSWLEADATAGIRQRDARYKQEETLHEGDTFGDTFCAASFLNLRSS